MKYGLTQICFLAVFVILGACSKKLDISMITATSMLDAHASQAYEQKGWRAEKNAKFVKLHAHFDDTIQFGMLKVTSCDKVFTHDVVAYLNFDEKVLSLGQGTSVSAKIDAPEGYAVRSITLNFNSNTEVCVKSISLFAPGGSEIKIRTPKLVPGNVTASSTLAPVEAYQPMNLFDSKFESAWASNRIDSNVSLNFQFDQEQKISKIKIWNGYQRSAVHCYANSRAKTIEISSDKTTVRVEARDIMGAQILDLPEVVAGKNIIFKIVDAYAGRSYKDLVISELRFYDTKNWFMLDTLPVYKAQAQRNTDSFIKTGLSAILNNSLQSGDGWTIRLRSDNSMYIQGASSEHTYHSVIEKTFYSVGNYQILSVDSNKLNLRVFGVLQTFKDERHIHFGGDCNGCGFDCNTSGANSKEKIYQDFFSVEKLPGSEKYIITKAGNTTGQLEFDKLNLSLE